MAVKLKKYFPMIREKEEVLAEIAGNAKLQERFAGWNPEQQEEFLNICTGVKGMKFLYDAMFKEVMNPEYVPERFNDFLSCMLCQKVKVLKVLPGDSVRIADETSLLIMDVVVELEDGSIANVEMQKIGYLFPGQRCACYSADLLLRQYRRVREETKRKFSYRDVRNVYTIVLFEKSPKEFQKYSEKYYHFFEQKSDTGLELELLQKYLFIPLDIFRKSQQNRGITNKRDAWLTLLSCDEPETIVSLIEGYPEFCEIYREGYEMCLSAEKVMDMFSKELYELDKNTVQYMIDEQQEMLDAQKAELEEQKVVLEEQKVMLEEQKVMLEEQKERLNAQKRKIEAQEAELNAQKERLNAQKGKIEAQEAELDAQKEQIDTQKTELEEALRGTVNILRELKIPDAEILTKICDQYQIGKKDAQRYLS